MTSTVEKEQGKMRQGELRWMSYGQGKENEVLVEAESERGVLGGLLRGQI